VLVLLACLIVPPWVSISRYQSRITAAVSASLGRPVRLSSVELRLLPRPGFVLTNLTVDDDSSFGAEPVLHANKVTAAIRLLSLWRGRLEISSISVDEASLNLVRSSSGHWNVETLFRSAAQSSGGPADRLFRLPNLEATESRINVKNGLEKLPFSLVDADLSFSQSGPGVWHVSLRGQPARTDVSLDLADTGIVEMQGDLHQAAALHDMPMHIAMEWRDAQLGQLSRLMIGSDPGWRGDLRGNLQWDGTVEAARVKMRLRATGVHRAEFAPAAPLDFDAICNFVYHYSARAVEQMACDSPLGDGHVHIAGSLPGDHAPQLNVQIQHIPVQAGLDMLRTMRSGIDGTLQATGTVSGELTYDGAAGTTAGSAQEPAKGLTATAARKHAKATPADALRGSLTVEGLKLTGDTLTQPIEVSKAVLEPFAGPPEGLATTVDLPSGGASPMALGVRLTMAGYVATLQGPASFARLRELAHAVGAEQFAALEGLAGDSPMLDVMAAGPWLPGEDERVRTMSGEEPSFEEAAALGVEDIRRDELTGTVTLHDANWKSDSLASPVMVTHAILHFGTDTLTWDPVQFDYGPLKGTAAVHLLARCPAGGACTPSVHLEFVSLDAETLQAALLGAHKQGTVLSELINRFTKSSATPWPVLDATVDAKSLTLGTLKLDEANATLHLNAASAELTSLDATLLGGHLHATGQVTQGDKPSYSLEAELARAQAASVCQLLGLRCTGGPVALNGHVELAGFSGSDLAASAKGNLHFTWKTGAMAKTAGAEMPAFLAHFSSWSGDATIGQGKVELGPNTLKQGAQGITVAATIPLVKALHIHFAVPQEDSTAKTNMQNAGAR
jgi:hypothetical protein